MLAEKGNRAMWFPFSYLDIIMLLSGLDSKKYQSILRFKRDLKENPKLFADAILSESIADSNREIDKYGELVQRILSC